MVCNTNTCMPLIAEESKGTEFQKQWHSQMRNCTCQASLVKPASRTKAGLQQEDCSREGGLVALQSRNSCILLLGTCTEAPKFFICSASSLALLLPGEGAQNTLQPSLLQQSPRCCPTAPGTQGLPEGGVPGAGAAPAHPGKRGRLRKLCCAVQKRV